MTDTTGDTTDRITEEVITFLAAALRRQVGPEDDYFALGLVDSLFALELVTFVEDHFGLTVEVEDLDLDSFRTAARITRFVRRKQAMAGPSSGGPQEASAGGSTAGSGHDLLKARDARG
jgi:acyl carrier protein